MDVSEAKSRGVKEEILASIKKSTSYYQVPCTSGPHAKDTHEHASCKALPCHVQIDKVKLN